MADEPSQFAALMERVAQGDELAPAELFDQYHKALILVIRHRLSQFPQLRVLFDSDDFLQEIWQDVFAHPEKLGEFSTFRRFLRYLAGVACHKIATARRKYLSAEKRDLRRHRHFSDPGVAASLAAVADPQPGPVQAASSHETWVRWLVSLTPPQRQIVLMRRGGHSYQEIAAEFGCSERSIRRTVAELRGMPAPVQLSYL